MSKRVQTKNEELANAITHAVGILFCLIAMPFLLKNALAKENLAIFWAVLVFGIGMLMVYSSSTIYHLVQDLRYKKRLQVADHISIYFLIAGTYTPLVVNYLPPRDASIFLTVLWSLVAIGIVFKLLFTNRFKIVSVLLYLCLGWMVIFIIGPIRQNVPMALIWWMVLGGISYTVGVYFYVRSQLLYFHAIWHCFVLGGTVAHYVFIYKSI